MSETETDETPEVPEYGTRDDRMEVVALAEAAGWQAGPSTLVPLITRLASLPTYY